MLALREALGRMLLVHNRPDTNPMDQAGTSHKEHADPPLNEIHNGRPGGVPGGSNLRVEVIRDCVGA